MLAKFMFLICLDIKNSTEFDFPWRETLTQLYQLLCYLSCLDPGRPCPSAIPIGSPGINKNSFSEKNHSKLIFCIHPQTVAVSNILSLTIMLQVSGSLYSIWPPPFDGFLFRGSPCNTFVQLSLSAFKKCVDLAAKQNGCIGPAKNKIGVNEYQHSRCRGEPLSRWKGWLQILWHCGMNYYLL